MDKQFIEHIKCRCGHEEHRELRTVKLGQFIDKERKLKAAFVTSYTCPECGSIGKEKRKIIEA